MAPLSHLSCSVLVNSSFPPARDCINFKSLSPVNRLAALSWDRLLVSYHQGWKLWSHSYSPFFSPRSDSGPCSLPLTFYIPSFCVPPPRSPSPNSQVCSITSLPSPYPSHLFFFLFRFCRVGGGGPFSFGNLYGWRPDEGGIYYRGYPLRAKSNPP